MSLKKRIASLLPQDGFTASVFTLLSGTTLALVIAYLAQPILTRLYPPAAFGLFEAFLAIVSILIPLTSLRYEDALMLPEKDEEASHVLGLSIILILGVCALSGFFSMAGSSISSWFQTPELHQWLYWIPPVLLAARLSKVFELWLTRNKRFRPISAGQATQSGIIASTRIAMASGGSALGLFTGYLAGQIATMAGYFYLAVQSKGLSLKQAFNKAGMYSALQRFRRFPFFSMPSALISALITRLPALLLLFFFSETIVGYFGRAYALFATPLSLLGAAISQVFFVEGVEASRNKQLPAFVRKVHKQLLLVGLFPTLAIMITGPQVFGFILGSEWSISGQYLQYIAPWLFLASIASPLTRTFDILERQRLDLATSLVMFAVQTVAFIAGGLSGDILTCLLYVCIGGSVARLTQICVILFIARSFPKGIITDYATHLLFSLPFLVLLYYIGTFESGAITTLFLVITGCLYLVICYRKLHK